MFTGQNGGNRYLPYAFTEQGIYMLMTVLRQVKNNEDRFPEDFRFRLTGDETAKILMSEKATSSWGGLRKPPYAFTEQGMYILMTLLRQR